MSENDQNVKCLCCTCGTRTQDQESGFCINGHDDWLQWGDLTDPQWMRDAMYTVLKFKQKWGVTSAQLLDYMRSNLDYNDWYSRLNSPSARD
jgi:hypothetical protein